MADIFISYKRERRPAARHLEQIFLRYGYSVWFDLALIRGADYEDQIQQQLTAAAAVIVLWCSLSVQSPGVRSEASRAKAQGKLIPVRIEACELPLFSTLEQNIDLTTSSGSPRDPAFDPVLDDLERLVGRPPAADLKALRDYEAMWRNMGGLSLARLPLEVAPVGEEAVIAAQTAAPAGGPAHDYVFWERQWERFGASDNMVALADISDEAPRIFANQARARIAEIQAERERQAEAERQLQVEAEQQRQAEAEWQRQAELERERQAEAERQRQIDVERRRQIEAEQHRQAELERERQVETERQRQVEADQKRRADAEHDKLLKPGQSIRDADFAPEMVLVPPGIFFMGSKRDPQTSPNEQPEHGVKIGYPLLVGKHPVTFEEWDACVAAGGSTHEPSDEGWGRGRRPVIRVSWDDATQYVAWLRSVTGKDYRLLSEAEWEYCCRAGTQSAYSFGGTFLGDAFMKSHAQFDSKSTVEVGSYPANAFGLCDMHGNVWEWVEDPYHPGYGWAPFNGEAWIKGGYKNGYVVRGGSWRSPSEGLRAAVRYRTTNHRFNDVGFRVARTLSPESDLSVRPG